MTEDHNQPASSLQEQLVALYADRERLELELGTAESEPILAHIRSLEERLRQAEHELREGEQAVGGTPSHHEAEMRLAEVVSERESFFENVASNNYDQVESTIEELKTQVEALELAMVEAQQNEAGQAEPATSEMASMDNDLQPQLDFPAEPFSEVQEEPGIEPLLESDLEFVDESLVENEPGLESEVEVGLEAPLEFQAELPSEGFEAPESKFSSMKSSDPAMDDAMKVILGQSQESMDSGSEQPEQLEEVFAADSPEPSEVAEFPTGDELMAEFGIQSPSNAAAGSEEDGLEGPLEMELEELTLDPSTDQELIAGAFPDTQGTEEFFSEAGETAADPISEPMAALPEALAEDEDSTPDLADELAAEFGIEPVAPESFPSESRDFSSSFSNAPSSEEPQSFGSFPSPSSSASQDTSTPIPQMAMTSNEPAAPFASQGQQTTSASASSSVATATETALGTTPLHQSDDAPAAASEVQSFVSSLATLFAQTDFVFEGQTPNGRFRFVGKNG